MIFYEVTYPDGLRQLCPTQADAKAIDRHFKQVDIPTDKKGLMDHLNVLKAGQQLAHLVDESRQAEADRNAVLAEAEPAPSPPPPPVSTPLPEVVETDATFSAGTLINQVELLGENPNRGFDDLEQHQESTGVGAAFSRGVHILNIIAAGEHQLARVFLKRKKK